MVPLNRAAAAALVALAACSSSPHPIDVRAGDTCAHCRMTVSDARFAGQVAAPGEEPLLYDDIGCLAKAVAGGKPLDHAYVADHRTRAWVRAGAAIYTHAPAIETPMGSHLIAHASEESRRADSAASGGKPMTAADVFSRAPTGGPHGR